MRRGHKLSRSFLNISGLVNYDGAERGLLSVAFPPDYRRSRRFYVYYNDAQGDIRVDEFKRRRATVAARGSRRNVIQIPHRDNSNHNGGQLQFLGHLLFLGTGDGGSAGDPPDNAQNKRRPARQAAADRPAQPARPAQLPDPPLESVRRPPRPRRDLQLRAAQPLALLVRPRHREATAARDRRRRPGQLRGGRLHDAPQRQRRQLRLGRLRGLRPFRTAVPAPHDEADLRLRPQPRLHGDRGLCRPRPAPSLALQALRLRRPLRGADAQPGPEPAQGAARRRRSALRWPIRPRSARTPATASTSARSTGRSSRLVPR